jgi:sortase A
MRDVSVPAKLRLSHWLERSFVAFGLALGVWWFLATAQMQFYASLPVPSTPARIARLPGEDPSVSSAAMGSTPAALARAKPGDWVARLDAPSVGLSATVIEGSTDQMLARAAGHIENTAFPGEAGNTGIAGHRDTTFRAVRNLKPGDRLRLTTANDAFDYRIDRAFIVKPEDVYVLAPTSAPTLTLVTCYPFTFIGHAPERYIVQATLASR